MLGFTNVDYESSQFEPLVEYQTYPLLPLHQALDILSRIHQLDHFIKTAMDSCHFPSEHGLTCDESAAIYLYTMDCGHESLYRVLDEIFREKDQSLLIPWYAYLKLVDIAVQKLPSQQLELWCGVNLNISKNYKKGDQLTWRRLRSCSPSFNNIEEFLGPISTRGVTSRGREGAQPPLENFEITVSTRVSPPPFRGGLI